MNLLCRVGYQRRIFIALGVGLHTERCVYAEPSQQNILTEGTANPMPDKGVRVLTVNTPNRFATSNTTELRVCGP